MLFSDLYVGQKVIISRPEQGCFIPENIIDKYRGKTCVIQDISGNGARVKGCVWYWYASCFDEYEKPLPITRKEIEALLKW